MHLNLFVKIKYLSLILILTACATVARYDDPNPPIQIEHAEHQYSLTIRMGYEWFQMYDSKNYTLKELPPDISGDITEALRKNETFSEVIYKFFPHDHYKDKTKEEIEDILAKDSYNPKTNLQLNLYFYGYTRPTEPWGLLPLIAMGTIHVASLGLVPMWIPQSWDIGGDIRSSNNQIKYKFHQKCRVTFWSWSPLFFSKEKKSLDALKKEFANNCINSILSNAQKLKAF
jgi:hypothetical protein